MIDPKNMTSLELCKSLLNNTSALLDPNFGNEILPKDLQTCTVSNPSDISSPEFGFIKSKITDQSILRGSEIKPSQVLITVEARGIETIEFYDHSLQWIGDRDKILREVIYEHLSMNCRVGILAEEFERYKKLLYRDRSILSSDKEFRSLFYILDSENLRNLCSNRYKQVWIWVPKSLYELGLKGL